MGDWLDAFCSFSDRLSGDVINFGTCGLPQTTCPKFDRSELGDRLYIANQIDA